MLFVRPVVAQTQTTENIDKSFAWDYDGRHWTWNLSIPKTLYDEYHSVPDCKANPRRTSRLRFPHNNRGLLREDVS